uniref:Uncharacterized protein n=1 Tax=Anguilla anguilla TaxID=7936 RepID=A0A0E9WUR8_ANGAN
MSHSHSVPATLVMAFFLPYCDFVSSFELFFQVLAFLLLSQDSKFGSS